MLAAVLATKKADVFLLVGFEIAFIVGDVIEFAFIACIGLEIAFIVGDVIEFAFIVGVVIEFAFIGCDLCLPLFIRNFS